MSARTWIGAACICLAASGVQAMFARMTLPQLVEASVLIVTGTLTAVRAGDDRTGSQVGVLKVSQVLKGNPAADTVLLRLPPAQGPRSGSQTDHAPGAAGLWFLRSAGPEVFAADTPQRFVPAREMPHIIAEVQDLLDRGNGRAPLP